MNFVRFGVNTKIRLVYPFAFTRGFRFSAAFKEFSEIYNNLFEKCRERRRINAKDVVASKIRLSYIKIV